MIREDIGVRPDEVLLAASGTEERPAAPGLVQGRVFALDAAQTVGVAIGDDRVWAQRSLSCLLVPEAGDRVLVARVDGEAFVLAVLDRLLPDTMTLSVPNARHVVLSAPDITLQAGDRLAMRGREATLDGGNVRILAASFSLVGRMATFVADLLRTTARHSETVAEQVTMQAGERTTRVKGTDVSEVGTHVQHVEQISLETAHSAVLTAKEDLRFDGTRVTVG
ncbi:DUF3540 domain-containing protein [Xanthobacter sediminis]